MQPLVLHRARASGLPHRKETTVTKKSPPSTELFWIYEVDIVPGQLAAFTAVARDIMATMEQEPGSLEYRYALNADETTCHIYERYRDSAGLLAHAEMFGRTYAERFMEACTPSRFSVYGTPDDEAKGILAQYGAQFFAQIVQPADTTTGA